MRKIVDEKFKDASPVDTVKRIQKILSDNGITVTEHWGENSVSNCYALSLKMEGTTFSSNGKGVTKELARASAYAEMMERIQSGMLGNGARVRFTDAQMMDRKTLKENSDVLYDRISKIIKDFDGVDVPADKIMEAAFDFEGGTEYTKAIPFYNIVDDKMVYIPTQLMIPLWSSTGLAAGNTPEEAMVQGMSEIVERWCQRHFLCKDLVPPTIPDEYLKQFPMAYETITQVRESGYDVFIKDCSMGMGWPAIATVVIDKKTHAYHVHMGASPVFEIALERSLTETFQGRCLNSVADTYLTESSKDAITYRKSYVKGRGAYPITYFTEESSFPFVPFEDRSHCSNRELLQYAVNFFLEKGMKIYVRDMSHWGFHTYQVIIPEICVSHFSFLTFDFNVPRMIGDTQKLWLDLAKATPDDLYELQVLNLYRVNYSFIDKIPKSNLLMKLPVSDNVKEEEAVGYIHLAYVEWACGNIKGAYDYAKALEKLKVTGISDYFSCLCRAREMMKAGEKLETVMSRLSLFYEAKFIEEVRTVLAEKTNPFAPYIVSCGERREKCAGCKYVDMCCMNNNKDIGEKVNEKASAFDNKQAFDKLRKLFAELK